MMKLKNRLGYALTAIWISMSAPALAGFDVFSFSDFTGSNGLNITTNSGDYFVPIFDSGWWTSSIHDVQNKNYFAGTCAPSCSITSTANHNNYFTFDLTDINSTITSASLNLFTYTVAGSSVDYQLFDVTSPLSEVHASGTNAAVYNDLMTGVSYGSFIYNTSDRDQFRSILLNADGVSALNNAIGGEFGIGGTVTGGIPAPDIPPIPEPETYAMWLAGLGLLGFLGYRRKIKAVSFPLANNVAQ